MNSNNKQEKISSMILNYLKKRPDAADTLEGIMKWWMGLEKIDLSMDEVANVLESLIQKKLIRVHKLKNGTSLYKIYKET